MLNEGIVGHDDRSLLKTQIMEELTELENAAPKDLEAAVFAKLTGATRDEIDWDQEDNKAGYFLWIKAFDQILMELVDDGYVKRDEGDGRPRLTPVGDADPEIGWSRLNYPK